MEWYVLRYDFNNDKIETWNVFNNWVFKESVYDLLNDFVCIEDFIEKLRQEIMYCFWSRSEYEIMISGLFSKDDKQEKYDVSMQLLPNIKPFASYIIEQYNLEKGLIRII